VQPRNAVNKLSFFVSLSLNDYLKKVHAGSNLLTMCDCIDFVCDEKCKVLRYSFRCGSESKFTPKGNQRAQNEQKLPYDLRYLDDI